MIRFAFLFLISAGTVFADLQTRDLEKIGKKVWQNECGGSRQGLTSWNTGEEFASLGIGHFIWYPTGQRGRYEESFPRLVEYLVRSGVKVPDWVRRASGCPWASRAEFQRDQGGARMEELRELLAKTVALQSAFLADRMRAALPKMLDSAEPGVRGRVEQNFGRLSTTGAGTFALIDYVNFKGEGVSHAERYRGTGWGLLQVLEGMSEQGDPVAGFVDSAVRVLERRVRNAPSERGESRWLEGWVARVKRYRD
jgi:hypothetical protein